MSKTQSGYQSSNLKITLGVFSIIDRVAGYMSTNRELQVKIPRENTKEKGLRLSKCRSPEVNEDR